MGYISKPNTKASKYPKFKFLWRKKSGIGFIKLKN